MAVLNGLGTRLGPGGLYGAISRLEARGLITALPLDDRRRPYQITESGLRLLRAQLETMRRLTNHGEEPPEMEQPLPVPSFYEPETDSDVMDEIDQFASAKTQPDDPTQLQRRARERGCQSFKADGLPEAGRGRSRSDGRRTAQ